ncbi:cytochrome P450 CYP749A22-like [Eucalyptus grandis]|uniref:cytochrome P450 CYP749A22-like n=1 Tax=Eucalyptus grandis TaxID=71139 RepID=UPI00192EE3F9|nr:cytochrome P450 CYP749A22-like [Eucalyptus grandis]
MVDSVHMLLKRWQNLEAEEVESFEEFTAIMSKVISRTAFGSSYIEGRDIFQIKIWKTTDEIESKGLENAICNAVLGIIEKREKKLNTGEMDDHAYDFLGSVLKAYRDPDESKRITIGDLVDKCKTFCIAGQETTNSILPWTLFFLAIHKDWQEEARKRGRCSWQ